jgi:hypothetical protein
MSWGAVIALCCAAYMLKILGTVAAPRARDATDTGRQLGILVIPVIAGLIAAQTLADGRHLVLDARLPAMVLAAVLVWRKAPLLVVVVVSAGTTAALRHAGL